MNTTDLTFSLRDRSGTTHTGRTDVAPDPAGSLTDAERSAASVGEWLLFALSLTEASRKYEEADDYTEAGSNESLSPDAVRKRRNTHPREAGFPLRLEAPPAEMPRLFAALESRVWECLQDEARSSGEGGVTGGFTLGITSAVPGEGKTTVALHLAMHIASNTFNRVCLIDLSLGDDEYSRRLGLPAPRQGLTDVLEQRDQMFSALQVSGGDGPVIMLAGRAPANPARVARSPRVPDLIRAAREMFDLVIVELPAIFTENALPLAVQMDGLAMVTRAGTTPVHVVNRALVHIGRRKVLGVVLNGVKPSSPRWLQRRLLGR